MYPQESPSGNPYDFIINPNTNAGKKKLLGSGNGFLMKIVLIVGGAMVLMVVVAIALSFLASPKANTADLLALAETQNEIARVANQGTIGQATDQSVKNFAINTQLSVQTQQNQLITFLGTLGVKAGTKQLLLKKDTTTDAQLKSALATSTFDLVFTQLMQNQLNAYATSIKNLYNESSSAKAKQLLATEYAQVQLLLKQVPSQSSVQ